MFDYKKKHAYFNLYNQKGIKYLIFPFSASIIFSIFTINTFFKYKPDLFSTLNLKSRFVCNLGKKGL